MSMDAPSAAVGERTPGELVERLFAASLGMFDVMAVYLGDQLGLYRALRDGGPGTSSELAGRAGIDERYAREWLEQQAATGILDVDDVDAAPGDRRFSLPEAYAEPLLDPTSPMSISPFGRSVVACAKVLPQLLTAFRTGGGVPWADYGADMIESQGDFNRPWLVNSFGSEILPAIPDVHRRLAADPPARVADVACGVGWAAIAIAKAYPNVRVDGFDLDAVIDRASAGERRSGGRRGPRDIRGARHRHRRRRHVRRRRDHRGGPRHVPAGRRPRRDPPCPRPGGVALIADEKTADRFTAPADDTERAYYGFSVFTCLPATMTERPTAAIGTVIRESTMRDLATDAGFTRVDRLDEPALDMLRFYRMTP